MRDVILLVGHGSRDTAGNEEIERFTQQWRTQHPDWEIQVCFIEFATVTLMPGLTQAANRAGPGGRVLVLPLILNAAGHVKMDIPDAIDHARLHFAQVQFCYAPHLGVSAAMLQILQRRLRKCMLQLDAPDPHSTGVIVLGRGSSDLHANSEMARITRWLFESSDHELVDLAFTGVAWPRLERVVQRQATLGMRHIVILPYYLFTGTLVSRIARQTAHLQQLYPQLRFAHSQHFGFEREIFELLDARVQGLQQQPDMWRMPCDGCSARALAAASGAFAHHHDEAHGHDAHHTAHHHAHDDLHPADSAPSARVPAPHYDPLAQGTTARLDWIAFCESCKFRSFQAEHAHAPH